jgi:hypothetical protein
MIRLSVVIPTHNGGPLLAEAVRSVEADRSPGVEILVVDDGSTDRSLKTVRGMTGVRPFQQPNRGPGAARNLGLSEARGELIGFLDADDIWLPGRTERLLADDLPVADLLYSDHLIRNLATGAVHRKACRRLDPPAAASLAIHNPICTSTVVARRAALAAAGGFREDLRFAEDWDLWLRMAENGEVAQLAGVWAEHRERPGSLAGADRGELHRAQELVLAEAIARQPALYRPVARAARAQLDCRSGIRSFRDRDYGVARRHLWRSVLGGRLRPSLKYLVRAIAAGAFGR